jgi:hypothetical protein
MFEKISRAAERLANNVSASRRGFLARMGQLALGAAGVLGGLLLLPKEAQATSRGGYCQVGRHYGNAGFLTGLCVCANPCVSQYKASQCTGFGYGLGTALCGIQVASNRPCTCM